MDIEMTGLRANLILIYHILKEMLLHPGKASVLRIVDGKVVGVRRR